MAVATNELGVEQGSGSERVVVEQIARMPELAPATQLLRRRVRQRRADVVTMLHHADDLVGDLLDLAKFGGGLTPGGVGRDALDHRVRRSQRDLHLVEHGVRRAADDLFGVGQVSEDHVDVMLVRLLQQSGQARPAVHAGRLQVLDEDPAIVFSFQQEVGFALQQDLPAADQPFEHLLGVDLVAVVRTFGGDPLHVRLDAVATEDDVFVQLVDVPRRGVVLDQRRLIEDGKTAVLVDRVGPVTVHRLDGGVDSGADASGPTTASGLAKSLM